MIYSTIIKLIVSIFMQIRRYGIFNGISSNRRVFLSVFAPVVNRTQQSADNLHQHHTLQTVIDICIGVILHRTFVLIDISTEIINEQTLQAKPISLSLSGLGVGNS